MKQCNQLNPKYETSNRTSDQFLQQIGEKRERIWRRKRREKMRKIKRRTFFRSKKRLKS